MVHVISFMHSMTFLILIVCSILDTASSYRRLLRIRPPNNPPMGDLSEEKSTWALNWSKSLASHANSDGHSEFSFRGNVLGFGIWWRWRWLGDGDWPSPEQFVRGNPVQGWTGVISGQGILVACIKTPSRVKWFHTQCDFVPVNILKMSCCLRPAGIARDRVQNTCSTSIDFPIGGPPTWLYFLY